MSSEIIFGSVAVMLPNIFIPLMLFPVIVKIDMMHIAYKDNLFRKGVFRQYNKNIKIY